MTCSEGLLLRLEARTLGPAAAWAPAVPGTSLRVHSIFAGTLNLEAEAGDSLVTLMGPSGSIYPHTVALAQPVDFRAWRLRPGCHALLQAGILSLHGEDVTVEVDLGGAEQAALRPLPRLVQLGTAHPFCVVRLAELQGRQGCELRMDSQHRPGVETAGMSGRLRRAALDLGQAAHEILHPPGRVGDPLDRTLPDGVAVHPTLARAVAALVGLGPGLTPAGDDFLCGFLAAAHAGAPDLVPALAAAVEANLHRTCRISGLLVRCAVRGFWPSPLVDLAQALAAKQVPEALVALVEMGEMGHSSGLDLATGFLFGLEALLLEA